MQDNKDNIVSDNGVFNPDVAESQMKSCNVCNACGLCAACLLDGPIPDAEVSGVGAVSGIFSW